MSNKSPQELETFKNSPAVKVLESLGKLLSLAEPYMKNGAHEDWQEFIATVQQIPAEFDRRVDEKVHSHMQAGFDQFDFVEPCEPECSKERHAYHQGQWDMANRMAEGNGWGLLGSKEKQ